MPYDEGTPEIDAMLRPIEDSQDGALFMNSATAIQPKAQSGVAAEGAEAQRAARSAGAVPSAVDGY